MRISSLSLHLLSRRQAHRSLYPPSSISSTYCSIALPVFLHKSKSSLHISTRVLNSTHRSYKSTTPLVHHLPLHYITLHHNTNPQPTRRSKRSSRKRGTHISPIDKFFFSCQNVCINDFKKTYLFCSPRLN